MIKRDPQEIADFFGCKFQVNPYTFSAHLWDANDEIKESVGYLNHQLMHMSNMDDDKFRYEPQEKQGGQEETLSNSDNKNSPCYQDSENSDNKHQSEVYANKEYCVVAASDFESLKKRVQNMMNSEWKPHGGIVVEHLKEVFFYQAMVRGI